MLINNETYINTSSTQIATPVVYKSQPINEEFAGKRFIAAALIAVSLGILSLQTGFVLKANAEGNPITSPISYSESPTATPSTSTAPVSYAEVSPSPSASASAAPSVAPSATPSATPVASVEPSSTPMPSASPSLEPSTEPSASPSAEPSITPTPAPTNAPSNNSGNSNNNNNSSGSSSNSAPSCNNEAPKAPKIVSAVTTGKNEITLNWEKPTGNVTHYSISYGLVKGKPLYGVANVGNVTSYKVQGLAGGVNYFFIVKAVNDCTPSATSNEVAVKVGGKFINTPAIGFKAGVLGKIAQVKANFSGKPGFAKPVIFNTTPEAKPVNTGLIGQVYGFFKKIF